MGAHIALTRSLCWLSIAAMSLGCDSSNSSTSSRNLGCTPGEQRACACPGGIQGVQICNADGTMLGECSSCPGAISSGGKGAAGANGSNGANGGEAGAKSSGGASPVATTNLGGEIGRGGAADSGGVSTVGSGPAVGAAGTISTNNAQGGSVGGNGSPAGGAPSTTVSNAGAGHPASGGSTSTMVTASGAPSTAGAPQVGGTSSAAGGIANAGRTSVQGGSATGGNNNLLSCGDGIVNFSEGCDVVPRNNDFADGCTPDCAAEPICPPAGGACSSTCGDGFVTGGEACDDGNAVPGDGCSATCTVEEGFDCILAPPPEKISLPMVVRDFNAGGDFEKGNAFATGLNYPTQGLLKPLLDANGQRPVLASTTGTYNGTTGKASGIASAESFSQWYNDGAPASVNVYHASSATTLMLFSASGGYSNRFGNNGDGSTNATYNQTTEEYCGSVGKEDHDAAGIALPCTSCIFDEDPSTPQCDPPLTTPCQTDPGFVGCIARNGLWMGQFLQRAFDGNPLFFPADSLAPPNPAAQGQISGNFDPGWPADPTGKTHNFSFTTEVRFWFKYDAGQSYKLTFVGDDDAWVFVNKRLALDIGGIHTAVQGTLSITSGSGAATSAVINTMPTDNLVTKTSTPDLALVDGGIYEVAVFQAERQTKASSYQLTISNGFSRTPSICAPK